MLVCVRKSIVVMVDNWMDRFVLCPNISLFCGLHIVIMSLGASDDLGLIDICDCTMIILNNYGNHI